MKKCLILVVSSQHYPYKEMWLNQKRTWDSVEEDAVETVFYFGSPIKENTDKELYLPINEAYNTMPRKTLMAFEWALKNKQFDYLCRVNSSTFVNKRELIGYVQSLPSENVFAGLVVEVPPGQESWCWGPQITLSRDVVEKMVANKQHLDETLMEDVSVSHLFNRLNIPYTSGKMASIDKMEDGWRLISYRDGDSYVFNSFSEIKKEQGHFYYRCKQDYDRDKDRYVMEQLFRYLK